MTNERRRRKAAFRGRGRSQVRSSEEVPPPGTGPNDDARVTIPAQTKTRIADADAVWGLYVQLLKNCQQEACKLIAKAWIKAVEPKKQTKHPYNGGDRTAPDWWPKPWGLAKDSKVRHKEPDHLYKRGTK